MADWLLGATVREMSPVKRGLMPEVDWKGGRGLWGFCDNAASHSQPVSSAASQSPACAIQLQEMPANNELRHRVNADVIVCLSPLLLVHNSKYLFTARLID